MTCDRHSGIPDPGNAAHPFTVRRRDDEHTRNGRLPIGFRPYSVELVTIPLAALPVFEHRQVPNAANAECRDGQALPPRRDGGDEAMPATPSAPTPGAVRRAFSERHAACPHHNSSVESSWKARKCPECREGGAAWYGREWTRAAHRRPLPRTTAWSGRTAVAGSLGRWRSAARVGRLTSGPKGGRCGGGGPLSRATDARRGAPKAATRRERCPKR